MPDMSLSTLAIIALHELSAFQSTAVDAQFAPHAADVINLSRMAGYSLESFEVLNSHIEAQGGDITEFADTIGPAIKAFHERTKPKDWYESLMKSYVHNGLLRDYAKALVSSQNLNDAQVRAALDDTRQDEFLRQRLAESIGPDETLGWRLALWGRKLVFETLEHVKQLPWVQVGADAHKAAWSEALTQHSRRMSALGLVA